RNLRPHGFPRSHAFAHERHQYIFLRTFMSFITVAGQDELAENDMRRVESAAGPIAVCKVEGAFYAFSDTCTHGKWSLSEGWLDGFSIECSLHLARFDIRTGCVLSPPATCPLRTFPVRIADGEIQVDISPALPAQE